MWLLLLIIFALVVAYLLVQRHLESQFIENIQDKSIFITGCDSGFAYGLVLKLLENGCQVFAGCYTSEGEENLKEKGKGLRGQLVTLKVDVTDEGTLENAVKVVTDQLNGRGLYSVVPNAGIFDTMMPDDFTKIEDYQKMMDVNMFGVVRTVDAFKPLLKQSKGRFVVMTSIFGSVAPTGAGPYTASKFAAEAYADVLRREMEPYGVNVIIIKPGCYKTGFMSPEKFRTNAKPYWDQAPEELRKEYGGEKYLEKRLNYLTDIGTKHCNSNVNEVVEAYFHALFAKWPRYRYYVGTDSKYMLRLVSVLPANFQDCALKMMYGDPPPLLTKTAQE